MPIMKADVLEVLNDPTLHNIRFSVGPINVNSDEYDNYVESEAIKVVPWKKTYSQYIPEIDTLWTKAGNPPLNEEVRSNLLHECTHAISDINTVNVTRLMDEAAAYLAQMAYALLLVPALPEPPIGPPLYNMMRQAMQLVKKYQLGRPAGYGAIIDPRDIANLAQAVHAIPDYHSIDPKEKSAADGVAFNKKFLHLQLIRIFNRMLDDQMRKDVEEMLSMKVQYVSHENWVTSDSELLTIFDLYRRGGDGQKKARQKLLHIFLTIDQGSATRLLQRLSTLRKGDVVSERFQSGIPPPVKTDLLAALQLPR